MAEFDVVIKDGTIVDGTRVPRYRGDIAVKDGRIAEIGSIQSNAGDKVIDATGLIVAPGFVDHHTHFDAQIFYDPYCTDAGWHGVTTVTIGNCGFGFAPVRREAQDRAMLMMTRGDVLSLPIMKHMPWDWETYPEFLDSVDRTPKGLNVMSRFPVSPMLVYVLGIDRARMGGQDASEAEVDEMKRLVSEGIDAGAHGWSAQRLGMSSLQGDYDGHPAPSDLMTDELVISLAEASDGRGMIQISQDAISEDRSDIADDQATGEALRFIEKLAVASDCMIIFNTINCLSRATRDSSRAAQVAGTLQQRAGTADRGPWPRPGAVLLPSRRLELLLTGAPHGATRCWVRERRSSPRSSTRTCESICTRSSGCRRARHRAHSKPWKPTSSAR